MRIGIFGGSFNPVHKGHLKLADYALNELNLDKIIFVPSYCTPLKEEKELFSAAFRVQLLRLALKKKPSFEISLHEVHKKGTSYTVDTMKFFKRRYGKKATFFFLSGSDALKTLPRWKSFPAILKMCRFVVMTRPGFRMTRVKYALLFMPFPALKVSASQVRQRLRKGESIRELVPQGTARLIKERWKQSKQSL